MTRLSLIASAACVLLLAGCASVSPDGLRADVAQHAASSLPADTALPASSTQAQQHAAAQAQIGLWLKQPIDADTAVRMAVLNNPSLQTQLAQLAAQDAERAQSLTLINPSLTLGRFTNAHEREIERQIGFSVVSLITLPWRARWQGWQMERNTLNTAQAVLRLAADARRAWLTAVAAQQSLAAAERMHEAAAAGGELARRMAALGNFSQLQQANELQAQHETAAQLARAKLAAQLAHEDLARTLGLWGTQAAALQLPTQLPPLPTAWQLRSGDEAEAIALRERLDVRALRHELDTTAERRGVARASALFGDIGLTYSHKRSTDRSNGHRESTRGWELELPLPIFDWGGSASAAARAELDRSAAQLREAAIGARSEARRSWLRYRTAWDLAQQQRTEVLPMAQFLQDEAVLRYNGMFISVWALLAQARATTQAVATATDAQRDFWLADVDLQLALNASWQAQSSADVPATGAGAPVDVSPAGAASAPAHAAHSAARGASPPAAGKATTAAQSSTQSQGSTQHLLPDSGRQAVHTPTHHQQGH